MSSLSLLLTWLSPAFPIGSFAYSHGLEWAVEAGDVTDEAALQAWIGDVVELGSGRSDLILLRHAYRADAAGLRALAELAEAAQPCRERRDETMGQGTAFALAGLVWGGIPLERVAYPVAFGALAAANGVGEDEAALGVPACVRGQSGERGGAVGAVGADGGVADDGGAGADDRGRRGSDADGRARRDRRGVLSVGHRGDATRDAIYEVVPDMTDEATPRVKKSANGPLRVGVGGPVGTGKTALMDALCKRFSPTYDIAAITNDIYTKEDAEFLTRAGLACRPSASWGSRLAVARTPRSARMPASISPASPRCGGAFRDLDVVLIESGGDNLAATFSPELADITIYVIDVSAGDKIPRKGGPGITRSDLLVINKIDLAPYVGASLEVMDRDSKRMRGDRPFVFTNIRAGQGVAEVAAFIERSGGLS